MPKTQRKLSWKPVRRGAIYCAPACGGGCTHLQYLNRKNLGDAIAERLGAGWTVSVLENLHWYVKVISPCRRIEVSPFMFGEDLHSYSAYLNAAGEGGGKWVGSGKTPEDAVRDAIRQGLAYQKYINAILEGLENWVPAGKITK